MRIHDDETCPSEMERDEIRCWCFESAPPLNLGIYLTVGKEVEVELSLDDAHSLLVDLSSALQYVRSMGRKDGTYA